MPTQTTPTSFVTFTDELNGFAISYPPEWDVVRSLMADLEQTTKEMVLDLDSDLPVGQFTVVFFAGLPMEARYAPNVNVVVESLAWEASAIEFAEAARTTTEELLEGYTVRRESSILVGGKEAVMVDVEVPWASYGFDAEGIQRLLQVMATEGKTAWVVSCSMEAPPSAGESQTCEAVVRSFRLLR